MAGPYEQQTNTARQPDSNQSVPNAGVDTDQVSDVPNPPSAEPGDQIVSLLQGIQQTVQRGGETLSQLERDIKRVEQTVQRGGEMLSQLERDIKRVEQTVQRGGEMLSQLDRDIKRVERNHRRNHRKLVEHIDRLEGKVEQVEKGIKKLERKVEQVEGKVKQAELNSQRNRHGLAEYVRDSLQQFSKNIEQNIQRLEHRVEVEFAQLRGEVVQVRGEVVQVLGEVMQVRGEVVQVRREVAQVQGEVAQVWGEVEGLRQNIGFIHMDLDYMPIRIHNSMEGEHAELRYPRHVYFPIQILLCNAKRLEDAQRLDAAAYLELPALREDATDADITIQLVRYLGLPLDFVSAST
ncbi:hypothetical protein HOY82DRAFT_534754 [Tuber indicum]|nr:hypothetical protein HOY82DRAFT_534754 [Tuber indicum]